MRGRLRQVLVGSLLLSLSFSTPISAQEPQKPAPNLKVGQPGNSGMPRPQSPPPEIEHLQDLVTRLLHHASDAGCRKGDCKILVTDFVLPDGYTSQYGMQLADDLSSELSEQEKTTLVVDRTPLQSLLDKDRICSQLQSTEPVARWLGKRLNANVVLVGTTKRINDNVAELSARFLKVEDEHRIGPSAEVNLLAETSKVDLSPIDGLPLLADFLSLGDTVNREKVYRLGLQGVSPPTCYYLPNPSYTDDARQGKFSGVIVVEGIVLTDGTVRPVRLLKGAPFGLTGSSLKTMRTWKCSSPATLDGKPVPVVVPFEVTFRLN